MDGGRSGRGGGALGAPGPARRSAHEDGAATRIVGAEGHHRLAGGVLLFLGCAIASVNTYVALFGSRKLGMGPTAAAALVAVLGVAGIAGRVGWSKAARPGRAEWLPGALATGAVLAASLLAAALYVRPLVWVGVVAVGVFAVSGNAVSMVLVMQRAAPGRAGQDSALVAAGFFAGFAIGPPLFGRLAEAGRYGPGWLLVAGEFAVAAAVATTWAVRDRRGPRAEVPA